MGSIIKNMTGATISSAYFEDDTTLEFFPKHSNAPKNNRVALVYGNNGSGKSTIAQGFREYKNQDSSRGITLELTENGTVLNNSIETNRKKVFVFDEEYILSRIKVKESGLDTIVLFGDQVDLDEQIKEIDSFIVSKKEKISQLESNYIQFTDNSKITSPDYWDNIIKNKLREPNGWAEKGSKIKQQRQNLRVNDVEIERLFNTPVQKPLEDINIEYEQRYEQLSTSDVDSMPLSVKVQMVSIDENIIDKAKLLLKKVLDRPELTEREERILDLFGIEKATNARNYMSDKSKTMCVSCFQQINEEYRIKVLEEIQNILNRDVEEFKASLEKLLMLDIPITTYQEYRNLPSYGKLQSCIEEYSKSVSLHNSIIKEKTDNLFNTMEYDESINIMGRLDAVNQILTELEVERVNYNRIIDERSFFEDELLILNDAIAHYAIKDMYISKLKQQKEKTIVEDQLKEYKEALTKLVNKKTQLDSQRKSFEIASEEINNSLRYIFFCNDRLSIDVGSDDLYRIKVNGKSVSPNKISYGERNALALCYFFTEIVENMEAKAMYSDEVILIIDDPVSSFDMGNRVGIMSLLRWKLGQVLKGCATSKVLIMTHDISVVFDIEKTLQEISKLCSKKSMNAEYCLFQLESKSLSSFSYKKHNAYTELITEIYHYAKDPNVNSDTDLVIGNMMRRVLEAFSTFNFKSGISEITMDERLLNLLPDEDTKLYYRNRMYRLVLNNESHFEENIRGAPETNFFSYLSSSEKKQTAKDVLSYMYLMSKEHILSHLPGADTDLASWCP